MNAIVITGALAIAVAVAMFAFACWIHACQQAADAAAAYRARTAARTELAPSREPVVVEVAAVTRGTRPLVVAERLPRRAPVRALPQETAR
jgi:hypothetical protein